MDNCYELIVENFTTKLNNLFRMETKNSNDFQQKNQKAH